MINFKKFLLETPADLDRAAALLRKVIANEIEERKHPKPTFLQNIRKSLAEYDKKKRESD